VIVPRATRHPPNVANICVGATPEQHGVTPALLDNDLEAEELVAGLEELCKEDGLGLGLWLWLLLWLADELCDALDDWLEPVLDPLWLVMAPVQQWTA
jgi:hypothetical protein